MSSSMTRTQAKNRTLIAQGAAVVLLVAGVALGITGLPDQSIPQPVINTNGGAADMDTPAAKTATAETHPTMRVHTGSIAQRLSMVDNAPDIPETVVIDDPGVITDEPQDTGSLGGEIAKRIRFIGYVAEGETHSAFVRMDGVQRIVREGGVIVSNDEFLSDITVKAIRPSYLIASDGENDSKINIGKRTGQSITMANGNEITPSEVENTANDVNYDPGILGDPSKMPAKEYDRRKRQLERSLRGESPRTEAARLKDPPVMRRFGANEQNNRRRDDE